MKLTKKNILIVGASQGIGAALALNLANRDNKIALVARREKELKQIQEQVQQKGSICEIFVADAMHSPAAQEVVQTLAKQWGKIDLAILNVGGAPPSLVSEMTVEQMQHYMDLNFKTLLNYFVPLVAQMRQQEQGGQIAHMNSLASFQALPFSGHYSSSKSACRLFLETAMAELHQYKIRISILCPGFMDTPAQEKNPNPKPFILSPSVAAKKMVRAIEREKKLYAFPFPLVWGLRLLACLPMGLKNLLYRRIINKK